MKTAPAEAANSATALRSAKAGAQHGHVFHGSGGRSGRRRYQEYWSSISVTQRKLQTPGNAEEHRRQEAPTINPIGPTDKPHRPSTKHYRNQYKCTGPSMSHFSTSLADAPAPPSCSDNSRGRQRVCHAHVCHHLLSVCTALFHQDVASTFLNRPYRQSNRGISNHPPRSKQITETTENI